MTADAGVSSGMAVSFSAGTYCSPHNPGQTTLSLDWATWDPRPVPGDLAVVVSSVPLAGVPPGWVLATAICAYVRYRDDLLTPLFTAVNFDQPWWLAGYVAQPPDPEGAGSSAGD